LRRLADFLFLSLFHFTYFRLLSSLIVGSELPVDYN